MFVELKYATQLTYDQQRWGKVLSAAGASWRVLPFLQDLQPFLQYLTDITEQARR